MKCEICKKECKRTVAWRKYCSGRCRLIAWALKKAPRATTAVKRHIGLMLLLICGTAFAEAKPFPLRPVLEPKYDFEKVMYEHCRKSGNFLYYLGENLIWISGVSSGVT